MENAARPGELIEEILASRIITDSQGSEFDLHSEISRSEGEFLRDLVQRFDASKIIEIGFANGISSLFLCDALNGKNDGHMTIIDPYQSTYWHGIGIANLARVNFTSYQLFEEPSEYVLPRLIQQGAVFDFAFVDGNHDFEFVMTDFLMLNRLLKPGGIIVFDDANFPAISLVIQTALNLRDFGGNYGVYNLVGVSERQSQNGGSFKRKMRGAIGKSAYGITKGSMKPLPDDIFLEQPTMIALQRGQVDYSVSQIKTILDVAEVDQKQLGMDPIEICQKFGITYEQLSNWRKIYE